MDHAVHHAFAFMNLAGLVLGAIAAYLMFRYPWRGPLYTPDGAVVFTWTNGPDPKNTGAGKRQAFLGRYSPLLLTLGLALQLPGALEALL